MRKADEKWFEAHGFKRYENPKTVEETLGGYKTVRGSLCYGKIRVGSYARWERITHRTTWANKKTEQEEPVSRECFYMFSCSGNGFRIEAQLSHRHYPANEIESCLKIVGLE